MCREERSSAHPRRFRGSICRAGGHPQTRVGKKPRRSPSAEGRPHGSLEPCISQTISIGKRVVRIDAIIRDAGQPCSAGNLGDDPVDGVRPRGLSDAALELECPRLTDVEIVPLRQVRHEQTGAPSEPTSLCRKDNDQAAPATLRRHSLTSLSRRGFRWARRECWRGRR